MSISPTPFGLSKQKHAMVINQALSKIILTKPLSDENFMMWSSEILAGLGSYYYIDYIESDEFKMEGGDIIDEVSRKCITMWMLHQMDTVNQSHFEPEITLYTDNGPQTQDLPAKLWKSINDHHVARSEELCLLYE
ncbi:hypothetical protein CROQUDRAFT_40076 [Cronartium quercuum f. sp. fusiforme G11]|uniref:Uncharacterized protein n=1 Tax=Cronartium quercuum f. sp. fusiforme G11 TaxID=708437 RepID=A0A9P6TEF6_9BASI|nr:hypothetical protein CROQUDRAFT_40076 [Cronartium quercuum f. sp. fusiforme G11]